ncbi:MAG TPA: hypothetical protein VFB97_03700 [Bacteroidales bacterium]|nr:hypothetical protein [Bacteroidales bacterium]
MKRGAAFLIILTTISISLVQGQNPNMEKLNAYKIAFFTKKMDLSSQEAEKFWPLYNEFQDKKFHIQQEKVFINRNFNQNGATMTDKELTEAGDKYISIEIQEASLSQEYHSRFKEILPPAKIIRLYQAENQYKLQLLNELQDRKQQGRGNFMQR